MSLLGATALAAGVFVTTLWLTGRVREYAIARRVLDLPNDRSSHTRPTPRGGGIAMTVTTVGTLIGLAALQYLPWAEVSAVAGGGAIAAAIGLADDANHVAPRWRLVAHFGAASWALAWFGGLPSLTLWGVSLPLGWAGYALAALYLVWVLNLMNFMDGIDGLAALETITVCVAAVAIVLVAAPGATAWMAPLVLAAAAAGFLVWNWSPARIFMGDAGSGFLGLLLGAFSLHAGRIAPDLFWSWLILLAVFVTDATVTLARRLWRGERVHHAHRSHAYQHAARRWGTHAAVTLVVGAVNLCWLFPIAVLVVAGRLEPALGLAAAYVPLTIAAIWLQAGERAG